MYKGKIVLASGDKKNIITLKNVLDPLNYDLSTFKDLKKLSKQIQDENPDVLVIDADTLDGDSYEVCKKIKASMMPKLPVVLMTTAPMNESMNNLIKSAGINEYIRKPVSYALLLDKVKRLLLVEEKEPETHFTDGQEFNFVGDLAQMPLPRILYFLKRDSRTGVLSITREDVKKVISFENGDPKFVVSNIVQECLGRLLVNKGRLTEEECEESLKLMKEWKKKQGETLIKMGVIEPYELDETLKMQAKERLFEAFGWFTGDYKFLAKKFLREDLTPLDIELPQIVLSGVRRYYVLDTLKKFLDPWINHVPVLNKSSLFQLEDYRLATWDAKTVRFFDGKRTFKDIIAQRIVREIDVYHLLFSFYTLGTYKFEESTESKRLSAQKALEKEMREMESRNAFQILDVDYGAGDDNIRAQFDKILMKLNSEKERSGESNIKVENLIKTVKEAYECLKDKDSRLSYLKELFLEEGILTKETKEVVTYGEIVEKGKEYIRKNDLTKAGLLFLNGIKVFPNVGAVHAYFGYVTFLSIGKDKSKEADILAEARKHLNKALMLAPEEEEPHLFYGKLLKYLGRDDNAKKEFTKVIQLNPDNKEALQELRLFNIRDRKKGSSFIKWKK